MNSDDDHNIIKLCESQFPELFDLKNNKINPDVLKNEEYFDKILNNIKYGDIIGLPTGMLNSFKIGGEPTYIAEVNSKIAKIIRKSNLSKNIKTAGVIGSSDTLVEPFGEISFTELISSYNSQVDALNEYVDLFIIYDISTMTDLRAALLSCKKTEKPVYVTVVHSEQEEDNCDISALGALITAQDMGADSFGISIKNGGDCTNILNELVQYSKIPLLGKVQADNPNNYNKMISSGVSIFIFEENINCSFEKNKLLRPKTVQLDDFFIFTHYGNVFFLEADTTEISDPISCLPDMEECISEACKASYDILRVEINSTDDAIDFAHNAHMSSLPVMFLSENVIALKMALMLYQGIALIDSATLIPEIELKKICKKYGAVVY